MKKTILVSAITTIVINAIMLLMLHFCPICDTCRGGGDKCPVDSVENKCPNHGNMDCCKNGEMNPNCNHMCNMKCDKHKSEANFHSMENFKTERAEFDALLTEEEKAEIAKVKEAFAGIDHKDITSEEIAAKYAKEFAPLESIAEKYATEIDAVFTKKHGEMPEDMNHEGIDEAKMAEMKVKFKMHFLTMEF